MPLCRMFAAGVTGLEPATSGVTGQFQVRDMHDDGHQIAQFMWLLASGRVDTAWLSGTISDVCCPIAARAPGRLGGLN